MNDNQTTSWRMSNFYFYEYVPSLEKIAVNYVELISAYNTVLFHTMNELF